ncbi:MAG: hypothetical protein QOI31_1827 [Solirubrobacterales bacterium]|jgi:hypothetical protein|nr:hypothetical protein [Solirubrobacterales bacterium]
MVASVFAMFRGPSALLAVLVAALAISACGDDTPDTDGGLSASELAAMLPDGGIPQAVAVDVDAAREAAGLAGGTDPTEVGTSREELRFGFSTFFALRDLAALTENPVRAALDHGLITAYAGHPYVLDEAITLVSSSQDFDELASTLEDDGWERDGAVVSTEGDPQELTYTAVGAGDGFIALGYDPEVVEAVASGEAPPSETGELAGLEALDAPVTAAVVPDEAEGEECVELIAFEDFLDETFRLYITVDGEAKSSQLSKDLTDEALSLGFKVESEETEGDTITLELQGVTETEQLVNSPAVLVGATLDENGPLLYDCG